MKVLITGATGLIGTQLTKTLLTEGISVHYLTTRKSAIIQEPNHRGFFWNPSEKHIDVNAFKDVTAIIHLVGATISKRWTSSYKKVILESRTQTGQLLYDTLQNIDHSITHFISASGISVYPSHQNKLYNEEETDLATTFLGDVVVAWEATADKFSTLGLRVAKIRTGVVFDKDKGAFVKMKQPIEKGFGAVIASGNQWLSWIHIEDMANLYVHVLKNGLHGVYNAVAPNPVTNAHVTNIIATALRKKIWLPNVPAFMLKLLLGEMASLVLESQLVSSKKIENTGFVFQYVNPTYVVQELL